MRRPALALAAALLAFPASADMYQDASNAKNPEALQNLTSQVLTVSGGILKSGGGSFADWPTGWWSRGWWGSSLPTNVEFLYGSYTAPVTVAGAPVGIGIVTSKSPATCGNNSANTGCNAALLVQNMGLASTSMVTSGITAYVETKSTSGLGIANAQAGNFIAVASGASQTGGLGIYAVGRRFSTSSFAYGAEIRSANETTTDCGVVSYTAISPCTAMYLAPSGTADISSMIQVILAGGSNPKAREGLVFNNNTISEKTINDQSDAATSINIGGTHAVALQTTGAGITGGKVLLGTPASYPGPGASPFERAVQIYSGGVQVGTFGANVNPAQLAFTKSRNATVGSHTAVQDGDNLGQLIFSGSDGTVYKNTAAMILASVQGAVSAGIVPTKMSFWTTNSTGLTTEVLRILANGSIDVTGGIITAVTGSTTPIYGTSTPTVMDIAKGTDAAPVTTAGQQIRILYRQGITKDKCFNNAADTGCNSPILVNAIGDAATSMVTSGATFYAEGRSPIALTDAQAINAISQVTGSGVGFAMGAYIQGIKANAAGNVVGAEISASNTSGSNSCAVNAAGIGKCDGIWLAARSNNAATPLDSALHIGNDAAVGGFGSWKQAITINNNAVFNSPNTGTISFNDTSSSETSLFLQGAHKYGIRTLAGVGMNGFGVSAPTARLVVGGDMSSPWWAGAGIAFRSEAATYTDTSSTGTVAVNYANVFQPPTLAATNAVTYSGAATVYIGGCPVAGTNVTITGCNALVVSGTTFLGNAVFAPTLDTGGTVAGSLCRTAGGNVIYKAGANCF